MSEHLLQQAQEGKGMWAGPAAVALGLGRNTLLNFPVALVNMVRQLLLERAGVYPVNLHHSIGERGKNVLALGD